jgi:hypothetical protein
MWTRTATLDDLAYCLTADAFVGVNVDRTKHMQSALADGGCFVGGRFQNPEGVLLSGEMFFNRPFVSPLMVEEHARCSSVRSSRNRSTAEIGDLLRTVEPVVGYVEGVDVVAAGRC